MRQKFVEVVLYGGPHPGPVRIPLINGELPPTVDAGTGEAVSRYMLSDEEEAGRRVYKPDPMLTFRFEDPPAGAR